MLTHVDPRFLDAVWPKVDVLLSRAVDVNDGECDLAQLRMQIAYGGAQLLVYEDEKGMTVGVVEWKQHANFRSAFFSYLAGHTSLDSWAAFREWARNNGASKIECLCGPAQERLYGRYGMQTTYRLMRDNL